MINSCRTARKVYRIRLDRRMPAVDIRDLATMLEIDLTVMGDKISFRRRLQRALNDACVQGQEKKKLLRHVEIVR